MRKCGSGALADGGAWLGSPVRRPSGRSVASAKLETWLSHKGDPVATSTVTSRQPNRYAIAPNAASRDGAGTVRGRVGTSTDRTDTARDRRASSVEGRRGSLSDTIDGAVQVATVGVGTPYGGGAGQATDAAWEGVKARLLTHPAHAA
jgi:hypothetical protein